MSQDRFLEDFRESCASRQVTLLAGAGVAHALSDGAVTAGWLGLLRDGLEHTSGITEIKSEVASLSTLIDSDDPSAPLLLAAAEGLTGLFDRLGQGEYRNWLQRAIGNLALQPSSDHWRGAFQRFPSVMTTNYDTLITESTGREPISWLDSKLASTYERQPEQYVLHIHGVHTDPRSVILSGRDYGRLAEHPDLDEILRGAARRTSLVLVGFGQGLDDPHFGSLLHWLETSQGSFPHRHYILLTSDGYDRLDVPKQLKRRITPIVYGDEYAGLAPFLHEHAPPPLAEMGELSSKTDGEAPDNGSFVQGSAQQEAEDEGTESSPMSVRLPPRISGRFEDILGHWSELGTFQQNLVAAGLRSVDAGSSTLACAVTGTGKTTLARIAMSAALAQDQAAMALVPTKALVAQEVGEWTDWATAWDELVGKAIRVYGSSRDHPESDRPVSRGRYDVAVAIYEKLGAYLIGGRTPLDRTSVLVVDEMQILAEDSERAAKLEALLTLVRMLPADLKPGIIGLSATLSPESATAVTSWLGVSDSNLVSSNLRPIPLDTYVVDAAGWKMQPDAHLLAIPGERPPPPVEEDHELRERLQRGAAAISGRIRHLSTGELAATLIDALLEEDPKRRIICFVPSRTAAQEVAQAAQALLTERTGRVSKGNPWRHGRFARSGEPSRRDSDALYDTIRYSDLPDVEVVIRGLRHGIAPHSAKLPTQLRRLLEEEFRSKASVLRVLVATDTLAVGLNLPADAVIATSVAGFSGSGTPRIKRLLPPSDLDNKGGRAGRRGLTARKRGQFFILVPSERDLQDVADLTTDQMRSLATIDGVFSNLVDTPNRIRPVESKFRDLEALSGLVLQVLCQDGHKRPRERWLRRVTDILNDVLINHEPDPPSLPAALEVLEELTKRELVKVHDEPDDRVELTPLGAALGASGLELSASHALHRLGRLATANAGVIDLLWNACRSSIIQRTSSWVLLPPVQHRHLPSLKGAVQTMALAYTADSAERRSYCAQYAGIPTEGEPARLVEEGSPVVSAELRALLIQDAEDADLVDINALLRALVAFEWSQGVPFGEIRARFANAIQSEERDGRRKPVELRLYYADVEQVCEQIAGVLRAAADVSYSPDGLDFSVRIRRLARQVEVGLPDWLIPIVRMRIPALHRQRLARLWLRPVPESSLEEILDDPTILDDPGISQDALLDARRRIKVREEEERSYQNQIARRWSALEIPGGEGDTFEDLSVDLEASNDAKEYLTHLGTLLSGLGASVSKAKDGEFFAEMTVSCSSGHVLVHAPHADLTEAAVRSMSNKDGLVILWKRMTPSALSSLAEGGTRARYAQPEHILSLLASMIESRGDGLTGDEVVDALSRIFLSSVEADSWSLIASDPIAGPPPFTGVWPGVDEGVTQEPATDESDI